MWFKNAQFYLLQQDWDLAAGQLEEKLAAHQARDCGKLEQMTFGWCSPFADDESDQLVLESNNCLLIAASEQSRILPTQVVREKVQKQIKEIEVQQDRKVGAREKRSLMDEMTLTLLPRAFTKTTLTYAYIDRNNNWLVINSSSQAKAEALTILLRKALGSLKIEQAASIIPPRQVFTEWVQEENPPFNLTIDDLCDLQDPKMEKNVIRCVNQNLSVKEIKAHIQAGKQVCKLALTWSDRVSFVIDAELAIKRIQFLNLVQDQMEDFDPETREEQLMADFAIFSSELSQMMPDLLASFGGLLKENSGAAIPEEEVTA